MEYFLNFIDFFHQCLSLFLIYNKTNDQLKENILMLKNKLVFKLDMFYV